MSSFTKTAIRRGDTLVFGHKGVWGGRLSKESGVVEIELSADLENSEVLITLFDDTSREDGHYSPVALTVEQAKALQEWLSYQINRINALGTGQ